MMPPRNTPTMGRAANDLTTVAITRTRVEWAQEGNSVRAEGGTPDRVEVTLVRLDELLAPDATARLRGRYR